MTTEVGAGGGTTEEMARESICGFLIACYWSIGVENVKIHRDVPWRVVNMVIAHLKSSGDSPDDLVQRLEEALGVKAGEAGGGNQ